MEKLYEIFLIFTNSKKNIFHAETIHGCKVDRIEYVAAYYKNELPSVCLKFVRYKLSHIFMLSTVTNPIILMAAKKSDSHFRYQTTARFSFPLCSLRHTFLIKLKIQVSLTSCVLYRKQTGKSRSYSQLLIANELRKFVVCF